MNRQQMLQQLTAVTLIMLFLMGCGGPATTPVTEVPAATPTPELPTATPEPPTATATPTPVPPTPTPTPVPDPRAGHWEGEGEAFISFDVTIDGNIRDFKAIIPFASSTCTIRFEEIVVEADNAFIIPDSLEKPESPGEKIEDDHIYGKFADAATIIGTYKLGLCGNTIVVSASEDTWSAEWKGP